MKRIIFILFVFVSIIGYGQVRPDNFPRDTTPEGTDAFYTQEGNSPRKMLLMDFMPRDSGQLAYTPTATGNTRGFGSWFTSSITGDKWVVFYDSTGWNLTDSFPGGSGAADGVASSVAVTGTTTKTITITRTEGLADLTANFTDQGITGSTTDNYSIWGNGVGVQDNGQFIMNTDNASFGFGGATIAGTRLFIIGSDATSSNWAFRSRNSTGTELLNLRNDGKMGFGVLNPSYDYEFARLTNDIFKIGSLEFYDDNASTRYLQWEPNTANAVGISSDANKDLSLISNGIARKIIREDSETIVASATDVPAGLSNGMLWMNPTTGRAQLRENGQTYNITDTGTGGATDSMSHVFIDKQEDWIWHTNNQLSPGYRVDYDGDAWVIGPDSNAVNTDLEEKFKLKKGMADVILLFGQSNARGRGLNSSASAYELAPTSLIKIWRNAANEWQSLDIGTNNEADSGDHGLELAFIGEMVQRNTFDSCVWLLKYGVGGTEIDFWRPGGNGYNNYTSQYILPAFDSLLNYYDSLRVKAIFSQGERDAALGNQALYGGKLDSFLTEWRDTICADLPVYQNYLVVPDAAEAVVNEAMRVRDSIDNLYTVVTESATFNTDDNLHFNYLGLKKLARCYLDSMYYHDHGCVVKPVVAGGGGGGGAGNANSNYLVTQFPSPKISYGISYDMDSLTSINAIQGTDENLVTTDIGYLPSGHLDTTAAKSAAGSGHLYASIIYDHSANSTNATQSDTANMAYLVYNGVVQRNPDNGLPALWVPDNTSRYYDIPTSFVYSGANLAITSVAAITPSDGGNEFLIDTRVGAGFLLYSAGTTYSFIDGSQTINGAADAVSSALVTAYRDGANSNLRVNGVSQGTAANSGTVTGTGNAALFTRPGSPLNDFRGYFNTLTVWLSDQSANVSDIESILNNVYNEF